MDRRRPLAPRIRTTVHRARAWPIVLVAPFAVAGILANLLLLACGAALLL